MSADRREPMGVQHLTVVPENLEPDVEADGPSGDSDEPDGECGDGS